MIFTRHFNPFTLSPININIIYAWIERLSDLLQIGERGISTIVGYMETPLTKEMR